MTELDVDGRAFSFPADVEATKYDDWDFYRRRFQGLGTSAVDIVAVSRDGTLYLVEVKDYTYREGGRRPLDLIRDVVVKYRDTLAGLAAARFHAEGDEQRIAQAALRAVRLRIVLHVELPETSDRLSPSKDKQRADLQDALRIRTRAALDRRATVQDHDTSNGVWTSRRAAEQRADHRR